MRTVHSAPLTAVLWIALGFALAGCPKDASEPADVGAGEEPDTSADDALTDCDDANGDDTDSGDADCDDAKPPESDPVDTDPSDTEQSDEDTVDVEAREDDVSEDGAPDAEVTDRDVPDSDTGDAGVIQDCELGSWRYAAGAGCLPADPCRDDSVCNEAHRICLNEAGAAVCGRCLDGWETDEEGPCSEALMDDFIGRFRVGTDYFWVWSGTRYERLRVAGVNLSNAIPGEANNSGAISYERYARWLSMMSAGGINVIRVYSLHPPVLYEALAEHNRSDTDAPIFLIQGVWLTDTLVEDDLHSATASFEASIESTVSALHGEHGDYTTDVSAWVLGWLPGREVFAREVRETDKNHPESTSYEGTTMRLISGTPTEVWLTERLDRLVAFEEERWGESRPVGFSSWMELDPLSHPTEPSNTGKDVTQVDLSEIEPFAAPAGHFISYHVYPYYPKFVSEDPRYRAHVDELGPNSYRGLLLRLRDHYRDLPVLVAEYGVPSSWGRAHPSYSGAHHGGLTEHEQGAAIARMTRDIHETRYAGGLVFHWQDGWWKPTWITNERTFPRERYPIWHDHSTPQQSYGLLAFEPPPFSWESVLEPDAETGTIADVSMGADLRALHVRIDLVDAVTSPQLVIGIDTYRADLGDTRLPDGTETSIRSELALELEGTTATLRVIEEYDLYNIRATRPSDGFRSVARVGGTWVPLLWQMTADHGSDDGRWFFEGQDYELGALRVRTSDEPATSMDAVVVSERSIELTLPWVLLQFADPSTRSVVHDDPDTDGIDGEVSEGVRLAIAIDGVLVETRRFSWATWDEAPPTTERLKASAAIFFETLDSL